MAAQVNQQGMVDSAGFKRMNAEIARSSQVYKNALSSTGMFRVEQLRVNSATDTYTKALQKQQIGLKDWVKQRKIANAAYREQVAMQQMVIRTTNTGTLNGKQIIDVSFPEHVNAQLDTFGNRLGWARAQMGSLATQTVNWGKNTQWAGRQLMTGFTIPVGIAAAAAGKLAFDMDASITKIQKVYDAGANGIKASNEKIRADAESSSKQLASQYGQASKDTLDIMAELAAAGKTGMDLRQQTADVSRAALLGDLDRADALKTNITLQSAYNLSTKDLADTWNYFNSIENSTVLTMQDISESIPRVSGIMNTLGVSVQDTTVLLTGFKAAGIDAVEGATALKSISFKIFNPSKKAASAFQQLTGINYQQVIEQGKGELIPTLTAIADATANLSNIQKTQVIGDLAGIHQGSKFAGLLTQLENLNDVTTQIGRANKVAQQSTTDWANTANGELETIRDSISNKLKRAFETLKVEMATAGKPFLEVGADILGVVVKLVKAFNGLPNNVKSIAIIATLLLAATGPAIMLIGLSANLIGNLLKMGVSLAGVATKFQLLTKEQRAAQMASKLAESGFVSETMALQNLTLEMKKYALAQEASSKAIMGPMNRPSVAGVGASPGMVGSPSATGSLWVPNTAAKAQESNAAASKVAAAASEKQHSAMKGVAESGIVFAAGMTASALSSNETVDNLANIAMLAAIAGPALMGAAKGLMAVKWAEIGSSISGKWSTGTAAVAGNATKFSTALKGAPGIVSKTGLLVRGLGSGILSLIGPVGLVIAAFAAGAVAWKLINNSINSASDKVKAMTNNPEALGNILGYTPQQAGALDTTSKKLSAAHDQVTKIRAEFGGVVDEIKAASNETDKFHIAMGLGLQVLNTGGTIEQAKQAVTLALQAAGKTADEAKAIVIRFEGSFDGSALANEAITNANREFQKGLTKVDTKGFWEDMMGHGMSMSKESRALGEDAGTKIVQGIKTAMDNNAGQADVMSAIDKMMKQYVDRTAEITKIQEQRKASGQGIDEDLQREQGNMFALIAVMKRKIITDLAGKDAADKFNDSQLNQMSTAELLAAATINLTDADNLKYLSSKKASGATLTQAESEKLVALEAAKNAAAQKNAAGSTKDSGAAAKSTATDLELLAGKYATTQEAADAFAGVVQSGTKNAMQEYAAQATSNFQDRMNAAMDAYKTSQDARMDALKSMQDKASKALDARQQQDSKRLDDRQKKAQNRLESSQKAQDDALDRSQEARRKAIEGSYDARIDKINKTMSVEQAAEDLRQKIFDAELTRISRMAEVANRNIDFNAALNGGNMDEAAKIMNDSIATQQQWGMSDANDVAKSSFDKRQQTQQAQIDGIEKLKQARLDSLKITEDAEKAALTASQQRQTDALNASLEREKANLNLRLQAEKDNLAARQKAEEVTLQRRIDQNVKAEQKIWDGRKAQLDQAIIDFQNFAPKNAAELQKHIQDISGRYDQFRVVTRGKFNGTAADVKTVLGRNITQAMQELAANKQWETVGADIAAKMVKGSFNMDMNQFVKWITTGEAPANWTASKTAQSLSQSLFKDPNAGHKAKGNPGGGFLHVGGQVGVDAGGRGGISGSALHRSEVPIVAQRGEFMVNKKESAKHLGLLQAVNSGNYDGEGMGGASLGLPGMMGAGIAQAASMAIAQGIKTAAIRRITADSAAATTMAGGLYSSGSPGKYGQGTFSAEQMANAAIIANVGSTMNMGARDIEIAIMTAITESGLKNLRYGDRDSQGLFQQRPSQGWGTIAQITDPTYAAGKFFGALKGVKNRGAMEPWLAAQAVQRSFDSTGANYRQYWDEAMGIFGGMGQDNAGVVGSGPTGPANRTGQNAINWAASRIGDEGWMGLCQKFVRMSLGAGGGFPSALAAWNGAKKRHGIANSSAVPAGVPVYWGGGAYGHVALSTGGGGVISTDFPTMGRVGRGTIAGISSRWHKPLLGWAEDINGKQVYGMPGLRSGGHTLSDGLAMLHNKETVLTAPLSEKLKDGVNNMASGVGNTYNIPIDARGTDLDKHEIVRLVISGIESQEARKPVSRKGSD